jgi:hypothetical protein
MVKLPYLTKRGGGEETAGAVDAVEIKETEISEEELYFHILSLKKLEFLLNTLDYMLLFGVHRSSLVTSCIL